MNHLLLLLALSLSACGELFPAKSSDSPTRKEELQAKVEVRKNELLSLSDPSTLWPSVSDCDGLLWTGLSSAAGLPVQIDLAEYAPGVLHRRPSLPCWNEVEGDVGSRSTISNDQVLGWLWAKWRAKDVLALQRLADKAESADWVIGLPLTEPGSVILKPNQIGMLGRAIYLLSSGSDDRYYRKLFRYYAPVEQDYERHLQALGIVLQGEITEALDGNSMDATVDPDGQSLVDINGDMMTRLEELVAAEPSNPGFAVALGIYRGDMEPALDLLLAAEETVPSYVRSKGGLADRAFWLAEWLFWADLAIRRLN